MLSPFPEQLCALDESVAVQYVLRRNSGDPWGVWRLGPELAEWDQAYVDVVATSSSLWLISIRANLHSEGGSETICEIPYSVPLHEFEVLSAGKESVLKVSHVNAKLPLHLSSVEITRLADIFAKARKGHRPLPRSDYQLLGPLILVDAANIAREDSAWNAFRGGYARGTLQQLLHATESLLALGYVPYFIYDISLKEVDAVSPEGLLRTYALPKPLSTRNRRQAADELILDYWTAANPKTRFDSGFFIVTNDRYHKDDRERWKERYPSVRYEECLATVKFGPRVSDRVIIETADGPLPRVADDLRPKLRVLT